MSEMVGVVLAVLSLVAGVVGTYATLRPIGSSRIAGSKQNFREIREFLRQGRPALVPIAEQLHRMSGSCPTAVTETGFLTFPGWIPPSAVPLSNVELRWLPGLVSEAPAAILNRARQCLPLSDAGKPYESYSAALGDLARPQLFFNNPTFTLIGADWSDPSSPKLTFSLSSYFATIDIAEALCHELAAAAKGTGSSVRVPSWRKLPLRRSLRDGLLDPTLRPISVAVSTLLLRIRPSGEADFFLNRRDPKSTVTYAGAYMVVPTGVFQPGSRSPAAVHADFDLWRTIMREFSEEVLGNPEADGTLGETTDYENSQPFSDFAEAIRCGGVRTYYLGFGMDPTELWPHVLTALVLDEEAFAKLAGASMGHF